MAEHVEVRMLYCGQGMTNWIEYFPTDSAQTNRLPTMLVLVDLGGNRTEAVEYIIERLVAIKAATGATPPIRCAIFSHQDRDHWQLIPSFLAQLTKSKITDLKIGFIKQGGSEWKQDALDAVDKLATATKAKAKVSFFSDYSTDYWGFKNEITSEGECRIRLVMANCPCSDKGSGMLENGTSAAVAIELGGKSIILPGDSTWETLQSINKLFTKPDQPLPCFALGLPHHGSLRTTVQGYRANKAIEDMGWSHVETFVGKLKPKQIGASAGYQNSHHHPMEEIVEVFEKYVTVKSDKHYLNTWKFADDDWTTPTRATSVWTTVTFEERTTKKRGRTSAPLLDQLYYHLVFELSSTGLTAMRREPVHRAPAPVPATPTAPAPTEAEIAAHRARTDDAA